MFGDYVVIFVFISSICDDSGVGDGGFKRRKRNGDGDGG